MAAAPLPLAPRRRLLFTFAATVLSIGLAAGALELVGRMFDPMGVSYYPETARYLDSLVQEEPIGYRNRPGLSGRYYGAPVTINARGMRDREIASDKAPGEFRVAVIGDSFPFGIGVSYEESIPARLESLLQARAPEGTRYRTMNFGVPSYNTEQELIQFDAVVAGLEPDAVILFFSFNDIFPKKWVFDKRSGWVTNLAQRSYAVSILFASYRLLQRSGEDPTVFLGREDYRPDHPRWLAIDRSLSELAARCRARHISFAVFAFDDQERHPVAMVRAVGAREGFPVLNVVPWRDARWADRDPLSIANSRLDSHPRPEGSNIYATLIAEALWSQGGMPVRPEATAP